MPSLQRWIGAFPAFAYVLGAMACTGVDADVSDRGGGAPAAELRPRRGVFVDRQYLTGTLEAARAFHFTAPRVPGGNLQIRWMEEDGTQVREGQRVLEFENSAFASDLDEKKLAARKAAKELLQFEAQMQAEAAEKAFAVDTRATELEKAKVEADVPKELVPLRQHQEKVLARERAQAAHEEARVGYESYLHEQVQERAIKELALRKLQFEIRSAEDSIEALALSAPRDGLLLIGDLPWEGRKLQVGDAVWPGFILMRIPDLSSMRVEARLSDVDDGRVTKGMEAIVRPDSFPELELRARVEDVTPVAQEAHRRSVRREFRVRLALEDDALEGMPPGLAVRVEVITDRRDDVLLAPRTALDLDSDPPRAFLANGDTGTVQLGECNAFECIVESGVKESTELATARAP